MELTLMGSEWIHKPRPQLATPISLDQVIRFANDDNYAFEEKLDGQRLMCVFNEDGGTKLLNRNGDPWKKKTPSFVRQFASIDWMDTLALDGELVGDIYFVFDILFPITDTSPLSTRRYVLEGIQATPETPQPSQLQVHPFATETYEKLLLAKKVLENGGEGIIIKDLRAPYRFGVRDKTWMKAKYVKSCDCIVTDKGREGKDNMTVSVYDENGTLVEIADVSALTGDGPKVAIGDVVTVEYLAWKGHRLIQPVRPILRDDKAPEQCTIDQLRWQPIANG